MGRSALRRPASRSAAAAGPHAPPTRLPPATAAGPPGPPSAARLPPLRGRWPTRPPRPACHPVLPRSRAAGAAVALRRRAPARGRGRSRGADGGGATGDAQLAVDVLEVLGDGARADAHGAGYGDVG